MISQGMIFLFAVLFTVSFTDAQAQDLGGPVPVVIATITSSAMFEELSRTSHPATDVYDGWQLGIQAWTFNRFTFFEAVDKTASLGFDWIEAYPGQKLSAEYPDVQFNHTLPIELRKEVKNKLSEAGVTLVNYGVVEWPDDEAEWRKVFEFAKDMGIATITAEPPEETLTMIDGLCQEFKIKIAIHNHAKPSYYWNPDTVLKALEGRSKWMGACGDTGHWQRSGISPVEAVKKLEGRLISLHFKDLNEFGVLQAHDVVWGTGNMEIGAVLAELDQQDFKGVFSVEFEHNWENSLPDIRPSVAYFNKIAGLLNPSGWKNLMEPDLSNFSFKEGSWTMDEGVLTWHGGRSYIWTNDRYGDFILDMEYMVSNGANSGIFFRTDDLNNYVQTGIEVQIHETTDNSKYGSCGSIYDCMPAKKMWQKKAGEWNHYTITCLENKIYVVHNGVQIIDMDLIKWTEPHRNPDGTSNKFNTAYKDMPREGHIGFQDHGQPVWFRNIKIKKL